MKRAISITIVVSALLLLIVSPALAYITAPTSISIDPDSVLVLRNLAETGDLWIGFHYSMPYASDNYSSTPASKSIMFRLRGTDNVTVLQTGTPYVNPFFGSNGYGEGDGSFYFSASDTNIPTWEDAITIDILGVAGFFSPAIITSYKLTPSDYTSSTTTEANRNELKTWVLLECDVLTTAYQSTGIIMKATSDVGVVLSAYGDIYFRGVIDGLQTLCPDLFLIQSLTPELMPVNTYNMSLQTTYTNRLVGDDLGEGFTLMAAQFGIAAGLFEAALVFGGVLALAIWSQRKGWGVEPGLLGGALVGIGLAIVVGDEIFTMVMIGSLVAVMGISWLLLMKRA